ncbi:hypothetical protein NBRC10512_003501 [Rhodotorula toruloides]
MDKLWVWTVYANTSVVNELTHSGSASSAFKQARTIAEKGRTSVTAQFDKVDKRFPMGAQGRTNSSSSAGGLASPGLATGTSSSAAPPPPPPTRTGGPPPPPGRARAPSAASSSAGFAAASAGTAVGGGRGLFSGMDEHEKQAFFSLLDEYFSSRPQFAGMFGGEAGLGAPPPFSPTSAAPPPPPAASRPPPPAARGIGHAIALYDYAGGQPEDLAFNENDRITVLEVVDDDWLKGELNGRVGIFPKSYTQMQG